MERYFDLTYDDDRSVQSFFLSSVLKARVQCDELLGYEAGADAIARYLADLLQQLTLFPRAARWSGYIPDSEQVLAKVKSSRGNVQKLIVLQTNADVRFVWATIFRHQPYQTRHRRFQNPHDTKQQLELAREFYWAASEYVGRSHGASSHRHVLRSIAERLSVYVTVMSCLREDIWNFIPPLSEDDQKILFG